MSNSITLYVGLDAHGYTRTASTLPRQMPGAKAKFATRAALAGIWPRRTRRCASSSAAVIGCTWSTKPAPSVL